MRPVRERLRLDAATPKSLTCVSLFSWLLNPYGLKNPSQPNKF